MASLEWLALPDGKRTATVIFLHGLDGHIYNTWRRNRWDRPWPIWLAEDIRGLAVGSVSYEARSTGWTGRSLSLKDRATSLFPDLNKTATEDGAPLIFVCHSLGGLVVKQLVTNAASGLTFGETGKDFVRRIRGVVFYGTPHGGADYGTWADRLRYLVWPTPTLQCLSRASDQILPLNQEYRNWAHKSPVSHLIVYETHPTLFGWIVKKPDADPGIPNASVLPGEADHFTVCKPFDRRDQRYRHCRDFIVKTIEECLPGVDLAPAAQHPPKIPDPLPDPPRSEPVLIPHLIGRTLIVLLFAFVALRGLSAIYTDPFTLTVQQKFERVSGSEGDKAALALRIVKDLQERKIGSKTLAGFLDQNKLQVAPDAQTLYDNFVKLLERFSELESEVDELQGSADPEVKSLGGGASIALKQGDVERADELAQAAELRRKLQASVRVAGEKDGRLEFADNWQQQNIVPVAIPQLANVKGGSSSILFNTRGAAQLRGAFAEIEANGLLPQIKEWCASFVPRYMIGTKLLSNHAFGTSFDINCTLVRLGERVDLTAQPDFARLVAIFRKHGFLWGGDFKVPDPAHFHLFRLDGA